MSDAPWFAAMTPSGPPPPPIQPPPQPPEESAGFVKLAMRNMVRKGRQSLVHFALTVVGLSTFLGLLAWLGRPRMPL